MQSVFLLYVAITYAIFAAYQIKHLGRRSAQRVVGAMEPQPLVGELDGPEHGLVLLEMGAVSRQRSSRGSSSRLGSPRTPPFALSPQYTPRNLEVLVPPRLAANHDI